MALPSLALMILVETVAGLLTASLLVHSAGVCGCQRNAVKMSGPRGRKRMHMAEASEQSNRSHLQSPAMPFAIADKSFLTCSWFVTTRSSKSRTQSSTKPLTPIKSTHGLASADTFRISSPNLQTGFRAGGLREESLRVMPGHSGLTLLLDPWLPALPD